MRSTKRKLKGGTGHVNRSWPMLLLLLLLILVPTVCVLWFMNEAVQNERLAMREQLRDAYRGHLSLLQDRLDDHWRQTLGEVDRLTRERSVASVFATCVRTGLADSVVCYDADARVLYPNEALAAPQAGVVDQQWHEANRLEYVDNDFSAAARMYEAIANRHLDDDRADVDQAARAWQAVARCYARDGRHADAVKVLANVLGQSRFAHATDIRGRLIVADAELRALQLMDALESPDAATGGMAERLAQRLNDYQHSRLTAAQRRFLMNGLRQLRPATKLPTLPAEQLAAEFIESHPSPARQPALAITSLPDVWHMTIPSGRALLLLRQDTLLERAHSILSAQSLPAEVVVDALPPTATTGQRDVFIALPAGDYLPGWRLTLTLKDREFLNAASNSRVTVYLWTGILGVGTIAVLALVIGRNIRNQTRLARLKNDLVATITHELKTPLSSMRLLVDTLIDAPRFQEEQVREYLQLIAKENKRLSRLIDNFLAFSRIERNRYRFEFQPIDPQSIITAAVDSVHERFHAPGCRFDVQVEPRLPRLVADADALVTVLLNLLDNAYKYSGEEKHIRLKTFRANGKVCFEVADNGIGLSPRDEKKIFRRFYQVNQHLSRSGGGCGLGLSIVQYIVKAHGGTIGVKSRPGEGSRFTIALSPAEKASLETTETLVS